MSDKNLATISDEILKNIADKIKNSSQQKSVIESVIVDLINILPIPFSGATLQDLKTRPSKFLAEISPNKESRNKYFVAPFTNISVSAVGPVFYINKKDWRIYTLLQRRVRDDYQWWFPGGYVELPPARIEKLLRERQKNSPKNSFITLPAYEKIKQATVDEYYKNIDKYGWQKARKEINDPKFVAQLFKKYKIKWPQEIDYNWQDGWQREVKEEMAVDIKKYKKAIIIDFKNHQTFMIGTERDRLINVDGRFCAMLGILAQEPKTFPEDEIAEARWVALDEISYHQKRKKHFTYGYDLTVYAASFFEEALFEIICHQIKKISLVKNNFNQQKISRFNSPQNIQSHLAEIIKKSDISQLSHLKTFMDWKFGDLDIALDLCGPKGSIFYNSSLAICYFLSKKTVKNFAGICRLNEFMKTKINNLDYLQKEF